MYDGPPSLSIPQSRLVLTASEGYRTGCVTKRRPSCPVGVSPRVTTPNPGRVRPHAGCGLRSRLVANDAAKDKTVRALESSFAWEKSGEFEFEFELVETEFLLVFLFAIEALEAWYVAEISEIQRR